MESNNNNSTDNSAVKDKTENTVGNTVENTENKVGNNIYNPENETEKTQDDTKEKTNNTRDIYAMVNNRIIGHLEKGVVPWHKTWTEAGMPKNMVTGKAYRGVNIWLLNTLDYSKNDFLSFKQVKDLGGHVKKGEKSHEVVFWKWIEKEDKDTGEKKRVPVLRYYRVFNISQCEKIPLEKIPKEIERKNNPIEICEKMINEMPKRPRIQHKTQEAYYNRLEDYINMPRLETFDNSESYYGAFFHEALHSTGHKDRLNRKELLESRGKRSENYAQEELTAEMGASYLKSYAGIPIEQLENNAAYIKHWLGHLKNDKRFIVQASAQAQRATDYILNITPEIEQKIEEKKEVSVLEVQPDKIVEPTGKSAERTSELKNVRANKSVEKTACIER
jgi:antirestriction protein ArdC